MTLEQVIALFVYVVWPVLAGILAIVVVGLVPIALARLRHATQYRDSVSFLIAFAALGVTTGFSTSFSREPAVGAVLPALLTIMSGVVTYAFSKDGLVQYRPILPHCITVLAIASLLGLAIGSTARAPFDDDADQRRLDEFYDRVELDMVKTQYNAETDVWKESAFTAVRKGDAEWPRRNRPPSIPKLLESQDGGPTSR